MIARLAPGDLSAHPLDPEGLSLKPTHGRAEVKGTLRSMGRGRPADSHLDWTETVVTTIRANCPSCGDVQLTSGDLTVRVCADTEQGSYCFRCPECERGVAKEASQRIIDLLVSSGVRMQVWRVPAEVHEERRGPALTPDDLLDFHLMLQGEAWFDGLAEMVRRAVSQ